MGNKPFPTAAKLLTTVTGPLDPAQASITDAHNHLWIEPVAGAAAGSPILNDRAAIAAELNDYRQAGGGSIVDCQPGGCGRDGRRLVELSRGSGVHIIAATGYHRRQYYSPDHWLFDASVQEARQHFVNELEQGLHEDQSSAQPARAGFIKIACEATLESSPQTLMDAAVQSASETGAAVQIHTEKGEDAERIVDRMLRFGLEPDRIVLCHMDKRPDFGLHSELAAQGVMLEYDTFYRPKYSPETGVWPLLERMIAAGIWSQVAIATDMAEASLWSRLGEGPGLTGFITTIRPRLEVMGASNEIVNRLSGGNIAIRLAQSVVQQLEN